MLVLESVLIAVVVVVVVVAKVWVIVQLPDRMHTHVYRKVPIQAYASFLRRVHRRVRQVRITEVCTVRHIYRSLSGQVRIQATNTVFFLHTIFAYLR